MLVKKLTVALLCLSTLTGLVIIGISFFNQIACEGQPINNNEAPTDAQQIWGERIIGQTFVAPHNNLNRIDIMFQTYQRKNTHNVALRLLEVPPDVDNPWQGKEIFKTEFNASTVSDRFWHSFSLPPISNSAEKIYLIALQSPQAVEGNAITVGGIERNSYLPGSAYMGSIPVTAEIAFRTCYQMPPVEKLQILSKQITQNRPGLWGNSNFYWLILLIYGLLLLGFFWKLIKWALT